MSDIAQGHKGKTAFVGPWVGIAIASSLLALASWAVSSPMSSSPDDDLHLSSIWCGQGVREGFCELSSGEPAEYMVPVRITANQHCFAFKPEENGSCYYPETLTPSPRVNQTVNLYPQLYYWSMSWLASSNLEASTILIRLANIVITVLSLTTLIVSLPLHLRRVPIMSILVTSVPLGIFLISSTNPSSWSYIGIVLLFSALTGFFSTHTPKARIILGTLSFIGVLLAAGSRTDAAMFAVVAAGLAFIVTSTKKLWEPHKFVSLAVILVVSLYFFFGSSVGRGLAQDVGKIPIDSASKPSFLFNLADLPTLWVGVFGTWGIGWLDTPMPPVVWVTTLSIFTVVVFSSVRTFDTRQLTASFLGALALVAVPMFVLTNYGLQVGQQIQPRYLLPLIALFAAVGLYRTTVKSGLNFSSTQVGLIGFGLIVANTLALNINLRRYVSGLDVKTFNLDNTVEWWWEDFPVSPSFVWLSGSIFFALFLFSLWKLRYVLGLPGEATKKKVIG